MPGSGTKTRKRLTREESDATRGKDEAVRTDELEKGLSRLVDIVATLAQ